MVGVGVLIPDISIHALREEGDSLLLRCLCVRPADFYPRPPRGGRHADRDIAKEMLKFLSTPSARRATPVSHKRVEGCQVFLSTPSARRATVALY